MIRHGMCYRWLPRLDGQVIIQMMADEGTWHQVYTALGPCSRATARRVIERGYWIAADQPKLKTAAALRVQDLDLYMNQEPTP